MGGVHKIFSEKLLGHEIFRSMFSWKICKLLRPPSYVLNVRSLTCFSWISTWHELLNWNYTFFIDFTVQKTKVKFALVLITKILISSSSPAEKWGKDCWKLRIVKSKNQISGSFPRIISFEFTKYTYCQFFLRNKVNTICFTAALKINYSIDIFMAYADVAKLLYYALHIFTAVVIHNSCSETACKMITLLYSLIRTLL